jgi:hypothetical protein
MMMMMMPMNYVLGGGAGRFLHEQQAALFPAKPTFTALILELPA